MKMEPMPAEMMQEIVKAAEELETFVDKDLLAAIGDVVVKWSQEHGKWQVEAAVSTLVDAISYLIADAPASRNAKIGLLAASSVALQMVGQSFIDEAEKEEKGVH